MQVDINMQSVFLLILLLTNLSINGIIGIIEINERKRVILIWI